MTKKTTEISLNRFNELPAQYYADPASEFMKMGEWVCKRVLTGIEDPELYEEYRLIQVGRIIAEKYVKKDKNGT